MKRISIAALLVLLVCSTSSAQSDRDLKVFISVDMEGLTGVAHWEEVTRGGKDYDYFRNIMTQEVNAAIEGAIASGAIEITVRDCHDSARNILPGLLHKKAKLLREYSGSGMNMMEGIDKTFDAVIFIGFHAKAGTPDAVLEHTFSGNIADVSINDVSLSEAGFSALIAGMYDVPIVFISGDKAVCKHAEKLFGGVETVAVKEGIGGAVLSLHPEIANDKIRVGVERALRNLEKYKPYKLKAPYILVLKLKNEEMVYNGQFYPGAIRTGDWELTYKTDDLMDAVNAFKGMRK